MFLAEANQWPEDAVAYFGEGDECHMAFHFPLMPRLFMALHQEDRFPIHDIMAQTPAIPETCQWCLFLRNHDELTLEMVTDEERDYMYRAYARDRHARINLGIRHRLAPLLRNDRRRIELMFALLFSLPGTPVIYYGDEIGMGDNIYLGDRNGVRTPMQWSADRNAGFSRANPQKLYLPVVIDPEYHYETVNVEAQQGNPSSLLWWIKRLVDLAQDVPGLRPGLVSDCCARTTRRSWPSSASIEDERILVVANLSRFVQYVQLDLKDYAGVVPEEVFGRTRFPRIGELPYLLTLGPHAFMWFHLPSPSGPVGVTTEVSTKSRTKRELPLLPGKLTLAKRFRQLGWADIEALLPNYLLRNRLIDARRSIAASRIVHASPLEARDTEVWFLLVRLETRSGGSEVVSLGLTFVPESHADQLMVPLEEVGLARILEPEPGYLCDVLAVPDRCLGILRGILSGRTQSLEEGEVAAVSLATEAEPSANLDAIMPLSLRRSERNNTSVRFGDSYILKVFRRAEEGINPDLEIGRLLTEQSDFHGAASVVGYVEYRRRGKDPIILGVLHRYVPNQGTAWQVTLDQLSQYFERVPRSPLSNHPALHRVVDSRTPRMSILEAMSGTR